MDIRPGTPDDIDALETLYNTLNDALAAAVNYPGWKRGVYPTRADAEAGIRDGCLFIAAENGKPTGSLILRSDPEPAYRTAAWSLPLSDREVLIVHTLAVAPEMQRRGIGEALLSFAAQYGRSRGVRALRLDVYEKNTPAMALYRRCGFRCIATVSMGLENCGLDRFLLYEKLL